MTAILTHKTASAHDPWASFAGKRWRTAIDVRDFIQSNYTPYTGDSSFLARPSERTTALWARLAAMFPVEQKLGIYDVDVHRPAGITAHPPGYIDRENELIVGLQTDAPLKRAIMPNGEPGASDDEIVLGVEPQEDEAPIRFAFAMAAALGAMLTVVRAWWPHPAYGSYPEDIMTADRDQAAQAEALISRLLDEYPDVKVSVSAMRGNAVPMLIEASRDARLLVVGAHRRRSPLSVGAGYVVQGLLSHSPTPVAVIPIM